MRIIVACALLLIFTSLMAAEEKEIWACQVTGSTGFQWRGDRWEAVDFIRQSYLITLNGEESRLKVNDDAEPFAFNCLDTGRDWRCHSTFGWYFVLNPLTGEGGLAQLNGAAGTFMDLIQRDSVVAEIFQCTKF